VPTEKQEGFVRGACMQNCSSPKALFFLAQMHHKPFIGRTRTAEGVSSAPADPPGGPRVWGSREGEGEDGTRKRREKGRGWGREEY